MEKETSVGHRVLGMDALGWGVMGKVGPLDGRGGSYVMCRVDGWGYREFGVKKRESVGRGFELRWSLG